MSKDISPLIIQRIADYKNQVAGKYRSLSPQDISSAGFSGETIISPKIDGETWFLYSQNGKAWLLSPSGKVITDIPATDEAAEMLGNRELLTAGELHAVGNSGRPRLHDLQSALGAEGDKTTIRFASFDLLQENDTDFQLLLFPRRTGRLTDLFAQGEFCYCVPFEKMTGAAGILEAYQRLVIDQGNEGIVIRTAENSIVKIKPEITLDVTVVGFTEKIGGGITELLLSLIRPDGGFQLIGRVNTGFSNADRYELSRLLQPLATQSSYLASSRSGALFRFVKPEIVIEVKCNDLLAVRSNNEPVRRMVLEYKQETWQAIRPMPAVSMINAVFRRIRHDKLTTPTTVRLSQVTDLVPIESGDIAQPLELPCSTVLRRVVLTKKINGKLCLRKTVIWKTNKEKADPCYPSYVAFFTDFSPGRENPLKTDVRVASTLEKISHIANAWLEENESKGWKRPEGAEKESPDFSLPPACRKENGFKLDLEITFARTASINFPVAVRRIKAMNKLGKLTVEHDDQGRPRHYSIIFSQEKLVESIRKIENLLKVIGRWKGAEFLINGDPLGAHEFQNVLNVINEIAGCWRRQKRTCQPCRNSFFLGCRQLYFAPSASFPGIAQTHPAWYAVGKIEKDVITINKEELLHQIDSCRNESLSLCSLYEREKVRQRIEGLPKKLDPEKEPNRWTIGYKIENRKPAWVFPKDIKSLPFGVTLEIEHYIKNDPAPFGLIAPSDPSPVPTTSRNISQARYADIQGQDMAVEMVRDYAELPLKHAALFQQVGIRPGRGILLWGPPGNGKTLLARAVAGESGSHIEIISGPEVLCKWLGEAERMLRETFKRAAQFSPSVIIMDEVDAIAGSRDSDDFGYLRDIVSQLLVLMDGLADRGRVLVIATTNSPERIDPAILRPGRIDRQIFMGPPAKAGRIALFEKFLARMPTSGELQATGLAEFTGGFSGAEIEHAVNEAGLLAVKEAIKNQTPSDSVKVTLKHFLQAIHQIQEQKKPSLPPIQLVAIK